MRLDDTKLREKLGLQINQVFEDSPALNADLRSGDIVLEADDTDTLFSFTNYIKGEVDTKVTLKINQRLLFCNTNRTYAFLGSEHYIYKTL